MAIPIPLIASGLAALGIGGAQQATENLSPDQKLELLKQAGQALTGTSGIMAMKDKLPEKKKEEEEEKKPEPEFEPDIPDLPKKDEEEETGTLYSPQDSVLKEKIRPVLSKDLLKPKYLSKLEEDSDISCGQCYAASEAAFHTYGKENGFTSAYLTSKDFPEGLPEGDTHWFLRNKKTGEIIDPTAEQFGDTPIPYDKGKGAGFLTKEPSKAAQTIIDRINQKKDC